MEPERRIRALSEEATSWATGSIARKLRLPVCQNLHQDRETTDYLPVVSSVN
jgi:hypothetical protein